MNGLLAGLFIAAFGKDSRLSRILWFVLAVSIPLTIVTSIVGFLAMGTPANNLVFTIDVIFGGIFISSFAFLLISAYIRFMIGLFQGIRQAPNRR